MAAASAFAPDPVESCVAEIVRAYGAWLKNPTSDVFESLGHAWCPFKSMNNGVDITVRLTNLGFNAVLRPVFGGDMHFDVWMRKSQRVDPASELGRMLGLPVPSPRTDKVSAMVKRINSQFTDWLLANDGTPTSQSPPIAVDMDDLPASDHALLHRSLEAHGWHADPKARRELPSFACFRRTPPVRQ